VTSPFAPVVRRARAIEILLAVRTERLLTAVAGEMAIFRHMTTVGAGLLRAETRLPARTAVPITEKNRLSLLTLDSAVAAALWRQISKRRAVRRATRIVAVVTDVAAKVVVELARAVVLFCGCCGHLSSLFLSEQQCVEAFAAAVAERQEGLVATV
jgi:hypothetical protein